MRLLNRYKQVLLFVLLILLWGCSAHKNDEIPKSIRKLKNLTVIPGNTKPAYHITFKQDAVYGNSKDVLIGRIGGIAVDDSGRVFIGDPQQHTIDVFEPDGQYLTHFGRKGHGPGEFEMGPISYIVSNQLYAFDPISLRISVFSLNSFTLLRTINLNPRNQDRIKALRATYINRFFCRNDGKFLVCFSQLNTKPFTVPRQKIDTFYRLYYLMNDKGQIISGQILKQRDVIWLTGSVNGRVQSASYFPFFSSPLATVSNDGHIFSARSEDFLIKEFSPNGDYLRAFFYPYEKLRLTREEALKSVYDKNSPAATKIRQSIVKQNDLPGTWPALNSIMIDAKNRLWISTIVKNFKVYQWWVLNQNGKLLARFMWPRNEPIEVIQNGYIYIRKTDTTTGISKIVRYRVTMN